MSTHLELSEHPCEAQPGLSEIQWENTGLIGD